VNDSVAAPCLDRGRLPALRTDDGRRFKLVFFSVLGLTVLLVGLHVELAVGLHDPTSTQAELIDRVQWAWGSGLTALFGLVGGKAL
jgi:hypothetical protein